MLLRRRNHRFRACFDSIRCLTDLFPLIRPISVCRPDPICPVDPLVCPICHSDPACLEQPDLRPVLIAVLSVLVLRFLLSVVARSSVLFSLTILVAFGLFPSLTLILVVFLIGLSNLFFAFGLLLGQLLIGFFLGNGCNNAELQFAVFLVFGRGALLSYVSIHNSSTITNRRAERSHVRS